MTRIDIGWLDLNLLKIFALVVRERSLTRAARHLSLGQPAVSHALARLRRQLGDPLFVRNGRTMEPTDWALALHAEVAPALERIERTLAAARSFDPATVERTFSIGMSDDLQVAFLPHLAAAVEAAMPRARLAVRQTDYTRAAAMLESRDVSVLVGYLDRLPAAARLRRVRTTGYALVTGDRHAAVHSLADYCTRRHVLVTFAGDLVGYVDETLARLGAGRSVALSVSTFAVVPYLLRESDYVVTVPRYLAEVLGGQPGLAAAELPFASPEFDISMAWHPAAGAATAAGQG